MPTSPLSETEQAPNKLFNHTLLAPDSENPERLKLERLISSSMPKARRKASTAHFVGNRAAKLFKDEQLKRIMEMIDKEKDYNGKLPHGCIRRYYQQEKLTLDWLSIHQLYGLRRRRTEKEAMEKEERELRELEAEEASKVKAKEEFARLKEKMNEDIAIWWDRINKDENDGTQLFEVISRQKTLA